MKKSSKEKYDLVMKMINEFTEEERCSIIVDMVENVELDTGIPIQVDEYIYGQSLRVQLALIN